MNLRRNAFVTTAIAGVWLAAASVALAQNSTDTPAGAQGDTKVNAKTETLSEVVVTGIRRSLEKSLDVKKHSDDVVEVVSSEAIGKFPDSNLAESLAHLPGISVDRQFGDGDRVTIDGTDPALNRVFIDGHSIASADWGGDSQDTDGRNFNYSYLSPDFISQLEVYKNPEAWIDEGSLGGTVIVKTRKPLDLDANTVFVSGGYKYNDRSSQGDATASLAYSWKNQDNTLGAIIAYNHSDEHLTRGGIEYYGYSQGSDFLTFNSAGQITGTQNPGMTINGQAATLASEELLDKARYPAYTSYAYFQQTRDRDGVNSDISWKPLPTLQFDLSGMYIGGNYNNFSQAAYSYNVRTTRATNANISDGIVDSASYSAGPTGSSTWNGELDENYRVTALDDYYIDLAYKWDVDGFKVTGDAGYTRAQGGTNPEYELNWRTLSGFTYGFNGPQSSLNWTTSPTSPNFWLTEYNQAINAPTKSNYNPVVPGYNNGQSFQGFQVGGIARDQRTDGEVYGKVDAEHDVEWGIVDKVLFGAKYSAHDNSYVEHDSETYGLVSGGQFSVGTLGVTAAPASVFSGLGTSGNATEFSGATTAEVIKLLNSLPTKYNPLSSATYDVAESVGAIYGEADYRGPQYHGNLGLRIVDTQDKAAYFQSNDGGNTYFPTTTTTSYIRPLPSFNFTYDATKDLLFRFGAAEVIARPRYDQLAGSYSISTIQAGDLQNGDAGTAGGGNPHLKPYDSINYEATTEWYFKKNSLLEGELFYRDVKSYIITLPTIQTLTDPSTQEQGSYSVSEPENAGHASVAGAAGTFWYDIGWGFGIQSNATYSEARTSNGYNLPFLSKYIVNVIPYYEKGPFSARVSYNYRTDYFEQVGLLDSNTMVAAYTDVDAQIAWHFTKKISLVFNATNLTDQAYYEYSNTKNAPIGIYKTGRVFGLNFQFRQ
jgi:iron complex outermembrane receptor protein